MPLEINSWGGRFRWLGIALSFALSGVALGITLNVWFGVSDNRSRITEAERRSDVLTTQVHELAKVNAEQDRLLQRANQQLMRVGASPLQTPRIVSAEFASEACVFVFTMSDGSSLTAQLPTILCEE